MRIALRPSDGLATCAVAQRWLGIVVSVLELVAYSSVMSNEDSMLVLVPVTVSDREAKEAAARNTQQILAAAS